MQTMMLRWKHFFAKMPDLSPLIADAGSGGRYRSHDAQSGLVFQLICNACRIDLRDSAQLNFRRLNMWFPETPA